MVQAHGQVHAHACLFAVNGCDDLVASRTRRSASSIDETTISVDHSPAHISSYTFNISNLELHNYISLYWTKLKATSTQLDNAVPDREQRSVSD